MNVLCVISLFEQFRQEDLGTVGGIHLASLLVALVFVFCSFMEESFFDEKIMKEHKIYGHFGRMVEAEIIDIQECVLAAGMCWQYYSVIRIREGKSEIITKTNRCVSDEIGRKAGVVIWGKRGIITARADEEETYVANQISIKYRNNWKNQIFRCFAEMMGVLAVLFISMFGIQLTFEGLLLYMILLGIIYLLYPIHFVIRFLLWKTKITW